MSDVRHVDHLLLLVGSNPLPNYLSTLVLKPSCSVTLLYTGETEEVMQRLKTAINSKGLDVQPQLIGNASDMGEIRRVLNDLLQRLRERKGVVHLNYTGGTKVMAAHARMTFKEYFKEYENKNENEDGRASYLYERKGLLIFDDGYTLEVKGTRLTPDEILTLHGVQKTSETKDPDSDGKGLPTKADAHKVASAVLAGETPELAKKLYEIHRENKKRRPISNAKADPVNLKERFGLQLSVLLLPGEENWNRKRYEKWCEFLEGKWLEVWVGNLIKGLVDDGDSVHVGVNCQRGERQFEVDLLFIREPRLYLVSCTTTTKISLCKSKLFEVALRARQLGGDLARSALVCLLHGGDNRGLFIDQLRLDIKDSWDAPNTPEVFGFDDLKAWAAPQGERDLGLLETWLMDE